MHHDSEETFSSDGDVEVQVGLGSGLSSWNVDVILRHTDKPNQHLVVSVRE